MKKALSVLLMSSFGLFATFAWAGSAREDSVARLQSSVDVLHSIMATPDKGIPEEVLSNAKCMVVVPDLIKGGFIFGGKHGPALPPAEIPVAGALRRSYPLAGEVGDCRSASKVSIWSCWS